MKRILFALAFLSISSVSFAQVSPTDKFAWDQAAATLAIVQGYRYELELDGVVVPSPLVATCTGTASPFACTAPIPAVTPATHTAKVRAVDMSGTTPLVGPFSDPATFTMRATPAKPSGLTVIPGA